MWSFKPFSAASDVSPITENSSGTLLDRLFKGPSPDAKLDYSLILRMFYSEDAISRRAKRAGSTTKKDTLQLLIEKIVQQDPEISCRDLYHALRKDADGIIKRMDEKEIVFITHKDREKVISTLGLKDRLTRAKKTIV